MVSRERERERRGSPDHAFDITDEPRAPIQWSHAPDYTGLVNHSIVPIAPRRSISPSTHRSLSLSVILISVWFWFLLLLWWCGSGVLVVMAFDCQSLLPWVELEFQWCVVLRFGCDLFCGLGFSCDFKIFCNKICLDAEKMWKICRKIAFSEYNQTHENIFYKNFYNATKHLKIFSFPENSIFRKYFVGTKHCLNLIIFLNFVMLYSCIEMTLM